ncbi:MAG: AURKAIP1/COX24 domain-containing protein [Nitrospirota bacterium]
MLLVGVFNLLLFTSHSLIYRKGGEGVGNVVKWRKKKMRKHKHRKLRKRTRSQRR